ncbi:MAG TPA: hypothetical protein VM327_00905 [Candidatus Thermoplasmatota archaeon]|nr:hypothetical protein [Candidatus Thermoplasmatota archaeon]
MAPVGRAVESDRSPFRKAELSDEQAQNAYHSKHDLREMYTRDNVERRRMGAHTLRRMLTTPQDKLFIARGLKIRDEYQVANNDDVVVVLAQQLIAEGKEAELDPKLADLAKRTIVAKRTGPAPPH